MASSRSTSPSRGRFWIICAAASLAMPALANDSTAETRAGGLVLIRNSSVDMVSEDLFVSAEEVRVQYKFRNQRSRAGVVQAIVAFPMPDRDLSQVQEGDVAFPSGFRTIVDGKAISTRVERKAMLGAVDHSATLTALGIPIAGDADEIETALNVLPSRDRARLVQLSLAYASEYGGRSRTTLAPLWTVKEMHYWEQAFRAGRDTFIEHSYRPGTGGSVGTPLVSAEFRASAEGRRMIAEYCIDAAFLAGLDRMARRAGGNYPMLGEQRIGYILTTGGNWRRPIGDFQLVVDKGAAENLVSFCGSGLRKISPTQFLMRRTNWRPDRDLNVLIVFPHRPAG